MYEQGLKFYCIINSLIDSPSNPCYENPCKNDGTCLPANRGNSFQCYCSAGFVGMRCERSANVIIDVNNHQIGDSSANRNSTGKSMYMIR